MLGRFHYLNIKKKKIQYNSHNSKEVSNCLLLLLFFFNERIPIILDCYLLYFSKK